MARCAATGHELTQIALSDEEVRFDECVDAMLGEKAFLLPLITAARQYWAVYHQMTAASFYEDLWFEALHEFITERDLGVISETPRGAEGSAGDYVFDGLPISHKTSSSVTDLAVLWDSLIAKESPEFWTSETPILFMGLGYKKKTRKWSGEGGEVTVRAPWVGGELEIDLRSKHLGLVGWSRNGDARILETFDALPSFDELWVLAEEEAGDSFSLNELELLVIPDKLEKGHKGVIDSDQRPGAYLFPKDLVREVPMGSNNRGLLIKRRTLIDLCQSARILGTASPLPVWPQIYADFEASGLLTAQREMCSDKFPIVGLADSRGSYQDFPPEGEPPA